MKKIIIPIIGIIAITIGLIGWQSPSHSQGNLIYPNPKNCTESVVNERDLMHSAWNENMNALRDQEKPTSEMVDEAFESMRTYYCWLDYLCETVLYSSITLSAVQLQYWEDFNNDPVMRLTSEHIDNVPGCADAEDVEIPGTKLKFMTNCALPTTSTQVTSIGQSHFHKCIEKIEEGKNVALMGVQKTLKENSVNQKSRALTNKLQSLLTKMHGMESHMEHLKQKIFKFDALLPCFVSKCD